ncbi:Uncharacterised protein [Mycobacteroides abscessus]|nr:Uncharacterised protein [Mycobacteroides abscessus]
MLLSMIVTITSWAPVRALSTPAMLAHRAPPSAAPSTASRRCSPGGSANVQPTNPAKMPPRMIWPCAPMLNRPARKPMPSPRPARMSGVATVIVSVRGRSARETSGASTLRTAPWKSAAYAPNTASQTAWKKSDGRAKK